MYDPDVRVHTGHFSGFSVPCHTVQFPDFCKYTVAAIKRLSINDVTFLEGEGPGAYLAKQMSFQPLKKMAEAVQPKK